MVAKLMKPYRLHYNPSKNCRCSLRCYCCPELLDGRMGKGKGLLIKFPHYKQQYELTCTEIKPQGPFHSHKNHSEQWPHSNSAILFFSSGPRKPEVPQHKQQGAPTQEPSCTQDLQQLQVAVNRRQVLVARVIPPIPVKCTAQKKAVHEEHKLAS